MATSAWGIDVGERSIKGVKVLRSGTDVRVVAFDRVECSRPQSTDPAEREQRILAALKDFVSRNRVTSPVVVSMPEPAFNRVIPLPPVDARRLDQTVQYEARQRIPFPLEEVTWAYKALGTLGEGEETRVAIFAVQNQRIHAFTSILKQCGLEPDILQIPSVALLNFVQFDRGVQGCTLILDMGAARTELILSDGQSFWTREIRVSGSAVTKALMDKFQISYEEAEELKRQGAQSKQADRLFSVIRPILENLTAEIHRSISHFRTQINKNAEVQRVLLAGSTSQLMGVRDFLKQSLGVEVSPMSQFERLGVGGSAATPAFADQIAAFCVATGLALQGVGAGDVNISMLPPALVMEKTISSKKPFAIAALALIAITLGLLYWTFSRTNIRLQRDYEQVKQTVDKAEALRRQWAQVTDVSDLKARFDQVNRAVLGEDRWIHILNNFNEALKSPELKDRVWLSRINSYSELITDIEFGYRARGEEFKGFGRSAEELRRMREAKKITCLTVELQGETSESESFTREVIERTLAQVPGFQGVKVIQAGTRPDAAAGTGLSLPSLSTSPTAPAETPGATRKIYFTIRFVMNADLPPGVTSTDEKEGTRT